MSTRMLAEDDVEIMRVGNAILETDPMPSIAWPGLREEGSLLLPLPEIHMAAAFGTTLTIEGAEFQRKTEFHITVMNRTLGAQALALCGQDRIRGLYDSLIWQPRRTGRYTLLHKLKQEGPDALECWSVIEHLDLPVATVFRSMLGQLMGVGVGVGTAVPHVTHFTLGDHHGIGVPDRETLQALRIRDLQPYRCC